MEVQAAVMQRILRMLLETLFWMFVSAVLLLILAVMLGVLAAPAVGYFSPLALLLIVPLVARTVVAVRRRRGSVALTYVEQAVRLNLPLPRMLRAAQRTEGGTLGYRLARLRQEVESGMPVGEALAEAVPEVPPRAAAMAITAERVGRLPQALNRLVRDEQATTAHTHAGSLFYRSYPVMMIIVLSMTVSLISVFVLPKFQAIFSDFGVPLPPFTRNVLRWLQWMGPTLLVGTVAAVLLILGRALWTTLHPWRPDRRGWGLDLGLADRALWYLPVSHGIVRDRGMTDVCQIVGDALEAAVPADRALFEASTLRVNRVLRDRVQHWARDHVAGTTLHDAARRAGMPRLVTGLLATARGPDGAADVMHFLARYYGARFSRGVLLLQGALIPVIVLVFGLVTLAVALSLFLPMVKLADTMLQQIEVL